MSVDSDILKIEIYTETSDEEIIKHFKDAQSRYKDVIGILAVSDDVESLKMRFKDKTDDHLRPKREHYEYKKAYAYVARGKPFILGYTL